MASPVSITVLITMTILVAGVFGKDDPNVDLKWGDESNNCGTEYITKPTSRKTYRGSSANPIVGLFATRYDKDNDIWGRGGLKGTWIARSSCYKSARAYYAVLSGTPEHPVTVDMTFGTSTREYCSWGYKVKVCFKY